MALEFLMGYGLDHHARAINNLIPAMAELPNFVAYIDSRMQETNVTQSIKRGAISESTEGITCSHIQIDKGDIMRVNNIPIKMLNVTKIKEALKRQNKLLREKRRELNEE